MTSSASAGFEPRSETRERRCGSGLRTRWSPWEVGAMVAGFVVFWPLGLLALFLKWKNSEMWPGSSETKAPWSGFKSPDFSAWKPQASAYGFSGSGNAAFDAYKREQMKRLDEERRKLEDEQKAFRDFVEKVRRAKDQDEFDRFMTLRNAPVQSGDQQP
jgi:hypothetical protein